MFLIQTIHFLL